MIESDRTPVAQRLSAREGGTVTSLSSVVGADGATTVFAGTLTGVFRSDDGGQSWAPTSALRSPFIEAVAVSPDFGNDQTAVAGTTDSGLHMTYNGGERWERRMFWGEHPTVTALAFSPFYADDETIAAGTDGRGVYISDNRGGSWNGYGPELAHAQITALAVAPHSADVMFAGAVEGGIMRSVDQARSWSAGSGLPDDATVLSIAVSPTFLDDGLALAGTEAYGLYRTQDHGTTWNLVDDVPPNHPINAVSVFGGADGAAIAVAGNTLWRSQDDGATWKRVRLRGARSAPLLALATGADGVVLAGVNGAGVIRSVNGGQKWAASSNGLTSLPVLVLRPSPDFARDGVILAGSVTDGVLVSRDGGRQWTEVTRGFPEPTVVGLALSPAFADDGIAFALSADFLIGTSDAGQTWDLVYSVPADLPVIAAAFSPTFADDRLIALGCYGGYLLISSDAGESWTAVAERFRGSAVVEVAFSPRFAENGTILAATAGEGVVAVYRSTDRGASWSRYVQQEGAYHWASLTVPDAEPADGEEFFCLATGPHVLRPSGTVVGHWNALYPSSLETAIRTVVASLDFADDNTLFVGTSAGVLRSSDRGRLWYPLVAELDGIPIESVAVARDAAGGQVLLVATIHGEVWRIDNPAAAPS
ncbi:MAG: hypothetical protein OXU21_02495 [Chloroflexota bacterium]|nr:hypothetical protein [Chloroflexota bacterium]